MRFERNLDPKTAMGIGALELGRQLLLKYDPRAIIEVKNGYIICKSSLYLENTDIHELPDNLVVEGSIDLTFAKNITKLPKNFDFQSNIFLEGTSITSLPDNLTVNGTLGLSNTKITHLPKNLTIKDKLYLNNSMVKKLPDDLKAKYIYHTLLESLQFQRGLDPKEAMGIGSIPKIKEWLKKEDLSNKTVVNKDGTIDTTEAVSLFLIENMPDYIQFNVAHYSFNFNAEFTKYVSLRGCPKIVKGNFSCSGSHLRTLTYSPEIVGGVFNCNYNNLRSLEGAPKKADEFHCAGNTKLFTFRDVIEVCDVETNITTDTITARLQREKKEELKKRKPVAQRETHNLGKVKYIGGYYNEYTKGYKSYMIYKYLRDKGPLTALEISTYAHEMIYGKTHLGKDNKQIPFKEQTILAHGMNYIENRYKGVNPKVIKISNGKFKKDNVYKISPVGIKYLEKQKKIFGE